MIEMPPFSSEIGQSANMQDSQAGRDLHVDHNPAKKPKHSFHAKLTQLKLAQVMEQKNLVTAIDAEDPKDPNGALDVSMHRVGALRLCGTTKLGQRKALVPQGGQGKGGCFLD